MKAINKVLYDANSKKFYANVLGSMIEIAGDDKGGGVIIVNTLPDTGEEGKIYYNTTTGTYYISDNGKWRTFNETTVVTSLDDVETWGHQGVLSFNEYILEPNIFYNISNWDNSGTPQTYPGIRLHVTNLNGLYAGRFTAWKDNMSLWFTSDNNEELIVPDNIPDIVNGHTYEFNVWQGVLILVDVTSTEQGGE